MRASSASVIRPFAVETFDTALLHDGDQLIPLAIAEQPPRPDRVPLGVDDVRGDRRRASLE